MIEIAGPDIKGMVVSFMEERNRRNFVPEDGWLG